MSKASEAVKLWRKNTKKRMIEAMGGQCAICNYATCDDALEFHHLDPKEKDVSLGAIRGSPRSWIKIVDELRKCILLCCLCHREVHAGVRHIPQNFPIFDEKYTDYRVLAKHEKMTPCPICGKPKPNYNKTCSLSCAAKQKGKVDWERLNLLELSKTKTITQIADDLNVSWNAVKKQLQKLARRPGTAPGYPV